VQQTPFHALTNGRRRGGISQLEINGTSTPGQQSQIRRQNTATFSQQSQAAQPFLSLETIEESSERSSVDEQETSQVSVSSNVPQSSA
jgi:hypothetical protein